MSDFWAYREGSLLRPSDAESLAELEKLPVAKPLKVEVKQPRNGPHHRLYWVMVHRIAAALGTEPENVSDMLKIETGHCTVIRSEKYGEVRLPRSIAFHKMDQGQFREFWDRCIIVICENWGTRRKDILAAVEDLIVPTERR